MEVFGGLLLKMWPVFVFTLVGYLAGRILHLGDKPISKLLVYVFIPLIVFYGMLKASLTEMVLLPAFIVVAGILSSFMAWPVKRALGLNTERELLACIYGYTNVGWFGIPTVVAGFGPAGLPIIISAYVGNILFGNTYGVYLVARTQFTVREALLKLLRIPAVYATLLGVTLNLLGARMPELMEPFFTGVRWVMSLLGMGIIGVAISQVPINWREVLGMVWLVLPKYAVGLVVVAGLLLLEKATLNMLTPLARQVLLLTAFFPIAANVVVFSSFFGSMSDRMSLLVVVSTMVSIVLVPLSFLALL